MKRVLTRLSRQFAYGEKGFTLVELLVVVAILGILSAVAMPSLSGLTARAKIAAAAAEESTVQTAISAYMAINELAFITNTRANEIITDSYEPVTGKGTLVGLYLRTAPKVYKYTIDSTGKVTQGEEVP